MLLELPEETIYFRRPRSRSVFDRYGICLHEISLLVRTVRCERLGGNGHMRTLDRPSAAHTHNMDVDKDSNQKDLWSI